MHGQAGDAISLAYQLGHKQNTLSAPFVCHPLSLPPTRPPHSHTLTWYFLNADSYVLRVLGLLASFPSSTIRLRSPMVNLRVVGTEVKAQK